MKSLYSCLLLALLAVGFTAFKPAIRPAGIPENAVKVDPNVVLDFRLVNATGYTIESVYIAPSGSKSWGDDVMEQDVLKHNEYVDISFNRNATAKKWDIYVTWAGYSADHDVYWLGFDLSVIEKITLHYDAKTDKTWADTE
jgi:hypothetical protein